MFTLLFLYSVFSGSTGNWIQGSTHAHQALTRQPTPRPFCFYLFEGRLPLNCPNRPVICRPVSPKQLGLQVCSTTHSAVCILKSQKMMYLFYSYSQCFFVRSHILFFTLYSFWSSPNFDQDQSPSAKIQCYVEYYWLLFQS